jgi:hypothetical protein
MKWYLLLAVLAGWLVTEVKDFFRGGALENPLALTLLKIIFICCVILMVSFCLVTARKLPKLTYYFPSEDQSKFSSAAASETSSVVSDYSLPRQRGRSPFATKLTTRANTLN